MHFEPVISVHCPHGFSWKAFPVAGTCGLCDEPGMLSFAAGSKSPTPRWSSFDEERPESDVELLLQEECPSAFEGITDEAGSTEDAHALQLSESSSTRFARRVSQELEALSLTPHSTSSPKGLTKMNVSDESAPSSPSSFTSK